MNDRRILKESYGRVWEAFQQSTATVDGRHDTPEWRARAGPYAACVVRVDARYLEPGLDELRQDLGKLDRVRLHPDPFLHIMLQELGFLTDDPRRPDEITPERLEEFAHAAVEPAASLKPIALLLGGTNAFQDAVFLEVDGGHLLSRLHARLFELAAIPRVPEYAYLPHCTVAHFAGETPAREAEAAVAPWRNRHFGELVVTEIEIVTLSPLEPYPALESYAVIPLR